MTKGYIERLPQGYTWPEAGWVAYQEPFHFYNSNGSTLSASQTLTLRGVTYRVFTVKKSVEYRKPSGALISSLPVGTLLLTTQSTTGNTYAGHMIFNKWKSASGGVSAGSWFDLCDDGYAFVDLGLAQGSEPSTRAIW